jgi:hypothetical protein
MKRIIAFLSVLIVTLGLTVPAHAVLVDNGNGTVTDTDTNLMWIQDANLFGLGSWAEAQLWINTLNDSNYLGYNNWRLPIADTSCGANTSCPNSEMGHLFHSEGITSSSPGVFNNVKPSWYWTGTEQSDTYTYVYNFDTGVQSWSSKGLDRRAWAVRVVPEPVSSILFITGGTLLAGRGYWRRRKKI